MNARPSLLSPSTPDVQAGRPQTEVSLTRVGVTGVEKVIRVDGGAPEEGQMFFAQMECFVDLNPQQAGVHMSRFEEIVNGAIDEVVLSESLKAEALAADIAGLRARAESLAAALPGAEAVDCVAAVGGGGAPGVRLPSAAVSLPEPYAAALRAASPPVVGRLVQRQQTMHQKGVVGQEGVHFRHASPPGVHEIPIGSAQVRQDRLGSTRGFRDQPLIG